MATVNKIKSQIEDANALGRANLAEKGVELSEAATTYEIMQGIADILSGNGGSIQKIVDANSSASIVIPTKVSVETSAITSSITADGSAGLEE